MTNPTDELRRENEQLKQELTRLHRECEELRERLKRSDHAIDSLVGYAAPE